MRIKSYFVRAVDDAITQARADFGDDALLLSTRQTDGGCEVVFGAAEVEAPVTLTSLRDQIQEIRELLMVADREPHLSRLFAQLTLAGFDGKIASKVVDFVEKNDSVRDALAEQVRIDSTLGSPGAEGAVIALVGPAGAGKTAALMKIAAFQKAARVVTLDTSLAARMQMQVFARKNGIAFTAVEAPEHLADVIEGARRKEIVLIDTPGAAPRILSGYAGIDAHLVVPAYMTAAAVRHAISTYSASKMIITRLDESPSIGGVLSEAARAGIAISLVASATSIHAATVDDLISIALGPEKMQAACA